MRVVAVNRRAKRDFEILESYEAGIALTGSEVKSLRAGRVDLSEGFAKVENGEVWLYGVHIAPWEGSKHFSPPPDRKRKLLLHKHEINRLMGAVAQKGLTLIPLRIYFNERGYAKLELALARGLKKHDKRKMLIERELKREIERHLRGRR
ncbi:MAG: hypothetical protein GDYSWBUE_001073 [Candidatus Fervidibacterota bacterium]